MRPQILFLLCLPLWLGGQIAPIGYYPFEGSADDRSSTRNNALIFGNPRCVPGIRGSAYQLDGVGDYFEMPQNYTTSPYMQVVARCRHPDQFPAIIHVDGTSRVQTVSKDCGSGIRQLLERWYVETGCPMLLNTSLNIRGEPMVNDRADADRFENFMV